MPIRIQCPHCGQPYALSDEQAPQYSGQEISCTRCGRAFTVPTMAASLPPAIGGVPTTLTGQTQVIGSAPNYAPVPLKPIGAEPRWALPPDMDLRSAMAPPAAPPPTGGLAIAALVCAILGGCVPIVPSLLAIVLAVAALRRNARDPRGIGGRGMATAAIVIATLFMVVNVAVLIQYGIPEYRRAVAETGKTQCADHLRAAGNALLAYAQANRGAFPDSLDPLSSVPGYRAADLHCPSADASKSTRYVYAGAGLTTAAPPECVLLYEPLDYHDYKGVNVLFVDGRVSFIGEMEAGKAVPKLRKGVNPPWTGSEPYTPPPPPPASQPATQPDPPTEPPPPPDPNVNPD